MKDKYKEYALVVKDVNKYFTDANSNSLAQKFGLKKAKLFHSVKNISFTVEKGSVFGILGPNGCGKSTLIRMMTTLILQDTGSIEVLGVDVKRQPSRVKDFIGRVSVDASFFMKLTPLENLDYAAGLYGLEKEKARLESKRILCELGLSKDKQIVPVEKLSRGQQQKIAIARGFLARPKIILLDEPTTGLDPVSKIDVLKFVKKVMKEREITIIITSHDMDEIEKLCDNLVIMHEGAVIAKGDVNELKEKYSDNNLFELNTTQPEIAKSLLEKMTKIKDVSLKVDEKKNNRLTFKTKRIDSAAKDIIQALEDNNIGFIGLVKILPSLEDVFVKLTGEHLD